MALIMGLMEARKFSVLHVKFSCGIYALNLEESLDKLPWHGVWVNI